MDKPWKTKTARRVRWTLCNYTKEDELCIFDWRYVRYTIYGHEICPTTGTPHLQGYTEFTKSMSFKDCKKLHNKVSFRTCEKSADANIEYCQKDLNNIVEIGQRSKQGARKDLDTLRDDILFGDLTVDEIIENNPVQYHQYGRTIHAIEDLKNGRQDRNFMTQGIWLFGPTGVGKSEWSIEKCGNDFYRHNVRDKGWWDNYNKQKAVLIDDFRGELPYSQLLELVDKHPGVTVSRRNRKPIPFLSELVIITSSLPPEDVYHNLSSRDSLEQLYRRFKVYECFRGTAPMQPHFYAKDAEVVTSNTIEDSDHNNEEKLTKYLCE